MRASLVQLRSEYCCALHAAVTWALHAHFPHGGPAPSLSPEHGMSWGAPRAPPATSIPKPRSAKQCMHLSRTATGLGRQGDKGKLSKMIIPI